MTEQGNKPIKEFRAGTIRAAIWRQEADGQQRMPVRFSIKIVKRVFDETAKDWRTTDYFFPNDLPRLCLVAGRAFEYIALSESEGDSECPAVVR